MVDSGRRGLAATVRATERAATLRSLVMLR
jgi:hypothetical protein